MFKQLRQNEIDFNIRSVQSDFPLINAVLLGKQEGNIFQDEKSFFIIHKSGFSFLKTLENFNGYDDFIEFILNSKNIPGYFHIYNPPEKLINEVDKTDLIKTKLRNRVQLKFKKEKLPIQNFLLPENYTVEKITEENFKSLSVFNLDIASKFWSFEDDFLKNGFGFFVCTENEEPVSVCYTACVASNEAEIDIATLKSYQQKGLAKAAASEFIQHCIANNMAANWDCFKENISSLTLAERLGFKEVFDYKFLSIFNKTKET